MRPILLALFGGLVFLLAATLLQSVLGRDAPQMRLLMTAMFGIIPENGYGWRWAAKDVLAYLIASAIVGVVVYQLGQLMYRRG